MDGGDGGRLCAIGGRRLLQAARELVSGRVFAGEGRRLDRLQHLSMACSRPAGRCWPSRRGSTRTQTTSVVSGDGAMARYRPCCRQATTGV